MVNKFYICSQDMDGKGPELIGLLERLSDGNLQFQYMLGKSGKFPSVWLKVDGFEDTNKVYSGEAIYTNLLSWVIPVPGSESDKMWRDAIGASEDDDYWTVLNKYWDYWEGIKDDKYPAHDSHRQYYFYKEIPNPVRRYDL